jgi:hypothetical protein
MRSSGFSLRLLSGSVMKNALVFTDFQWMTFHLAV